MVALSPTAQLRLGAAELRRSGREVFDLSAGELNLPAPRHVVAAATKAAARTESHHYGPTAGEPELRQAVARRVGARYAADLEPGNVLITHGAKQALFNTFSALVEAGDEVLVPAPYWVTFPSSVRLAGGVPVIVDPAPSTLKITVGELEAARTPATKALVLCAPNNPSGLVYDGAELAAILDWAVQHELWVVFDETYVDLAFGEVPAPAVLRPEAAERMVTVGGVSKSFAMTGWRVGWAVAPVEIVGRATAVQSHTTSNVSRVAQAAALAALEGPDVSTRFRSVLRHRLDLCAAALGPLGLYAEPDGAFYLFPDVSSRGYDGVGLAEALLDRGVVVVPGESFGCPGRIRVSFAVDDRELEQGLRVLGDVLAADIAEVAR